MFRRRRASLGGMAIFRVTVRGWFDQLTDDQRAALLAVADEHDVVSVGAFTEAGTMTYGRPLHTFTLRVQLRKDGDDAEAVVVERALDLARTQLSETAFTFRTRFDRHSDDAQAGTERDTCPA